MWEYIWSEGYQAPNVRTRDEQNCYVEKVIKSRENPWNVRIKRAAYGPTVQRVFRVIDEASEEVTADEIKEALNLSHTPVYLALNAMLVSGKIVRRIGEDKKLRLYSVAP